MADVRTQAQGADCPSWRVLPRGAQLNLEVLEGLHVHSWVLLGRRLSLGPCTTEPAGDCPQGPGLSPLSSELHGRL